MKKYLHLFGFITCIFALITICFFPIYKVDRNKVYEVYKEKIDAEVQEMITTDSTIEESLAKETVVTKYTGTVLQSMFFYGYYEDAIASGEMTPAEATKEVDEDVAYIAKNGVRLKDLLISMKHIKTYDVEMWKELSSKEGSTISKIKQIITEGYNPFPLLGVIVGYLFVVAFLIAIMIKFALAFFIFLKLVVTLWLSLVGGALTYLMILLKDFLDLDQVIASSNFGFKSLNIFLYASFPTSTLWFVFALFIISAVLGAIKIFFKTPATK